MDRIQKAVNLFEQGFNCSQAVLCAFADLFDLDEKTALKLASGFGGGMGQMGSVCGALSGAFMVIGLKYGSVDPSDKTAKYENYRKIKDLGEAFKKRTDSIYCHDLLGFDLGTPAGKLAAKQPGAFDECPKFVRIAAELVEDFLAQG